MLTGAVLLVNVKVPVKGAPVVSNEDLDVVRVSSGTCPITSSLQLLAPVAPALGTDF
jgi:hypothetical protein